MFRARAQIARVVVTASLVAGCTGALVVGSAAAQQMHPLDAPTWQEHWTVLEVLREAKRLDDSTSFSLVLLVPPEKQSMWSWREGGTVPRSLLVVTRRGSTTSEAVVDVANRRLFRGAMCRGRRRHGWAPSSSR
jgi:Cu2+-containing amine oxidase